jgi:hypothetical protein
LTLSLGALAPALDGAVLAGAVEAPSVVLLGCEPPMLGPGPLGGATPGAFDGDTPGAEPDELEVWADAGPATASPSTVATTTPFRIFFMSIPFDYKIGKRGCWRTRAAE